MLRIWKKKKVWLTAINYWKMTDSNFDIFLWFEVWQKKPLSAQILLTYEFCILQLFTTEVIVTCSIELSGLALPFMEFQDPGYKMSKIFCIKNKINIPKGKYQTLRIGLGSLSILQKSKFLKLIIHSSIILGAKIEISGTSGKNTPIYFRFRNKQVRA